MIARIRLLVTLSFLNIAYVINVYAIDKNAGTSGAAFLKIGAGARPTAMGDAYVGIANDVNSVYYNPAGLGGVTTIEATAMHTEYIQGLNYDFGAFAHPTSKGAFAISAATLKTDEIGRRGLDEADQGTFENQDSAYALSYGHRLSEMWSVGATARLVRQKIDTASAQTWAGDIGVMRRQNKLTAGFAIRHFGQSVKFNEESDPLPLTFDAGAGYRFFSDRLLVSGDVRHTRDSGVDVGLGSEWKQTVGEKFRYAVRAGYNSTITDADGSTGLTVGAGAGFRAFDLDFAWIPFGDLGNTFRYALHAHF